MKYIIVKHSVNIKYIMVKAFIFKMLVKSQKIVKQANSIWNNTTVTIYCKYTTLEAPNF